MDIRIQNQGQLELDSANIKSGGAQTAAGLGASPTDSTLAALNAAQDTASISSATNQLSGDVAIRQDRVDSLRSQMDTGVYTVNAHAVATAMVQNLFRS
jgi:anti-sigma28 factor (negative regulator of flagellin synthesis)